MATRVFIALLTIGGLAIGQASPAQAIGCISGGVAGAVAGHMVHHGVLGAVGGCIAGHQYHKHQKQQQQMMQNRDAQQGNDSLSQPPSSGQPRYQ